MASADCISAVLKTNCTYASDAMLESADKVCDANSDSLDMMEVNELSLAESDVVLETSGSDEAMEMQIEECEINLSPIEDKMDVNVSPLKSLDDKTTNSLEVDPSSKCNFPDEKSDKDSGGTVCLLINESECVTSLNSCTKSDKCGIEKSSDMLVDSQSTSKSEEGKIGIVEETHNEVVSPCVETCSDSSLANAECGSTETTVPSNSETEVCDVESLLATPVSKDYVNCVWSNEPENMNAKSVRSDSSNKSREENIVPPPSNCGSNSKEPLSKEEKAEKTGEPLSVTIDPEISTNNVDHSKLCKELVTAVSKPISKPHGESFKEMEKKDSSSADVEAIVNEGKTIKAVPNPKFRILPGKKLSTPKFRILPTEKLSTPKKVTPSTGKSSDISSSERNELDNKRSVEIHSAPEILSVDPSPSKVNKSNVLSITRKILPVEQSYAKYLKQRHEKSRKKKSPGTPEVINIDKPEETETRKPIKKKKKAIVSHKNSKISHGPISSATASFLSDNMDTVAKNRCDDKQCTQNLQASYKKIVLTRSLPLYEPPANSRFANGKMFECKACGDKFVLLTSLLVHVSRKSAVIKYECSKCQKLYTFNNRCGLLFHLIDHGLSADSINSEDLFVSPPLEGELPSSVKVTDLFSKCGECGKPVQSLMKHMQGNDLCDPIQVPGYPVDKNVLTCSGCGQLLPSNCALLSHLRFHQQKPPYNCPECGDVFKTHSLLSDHVQTCCFLVCKEIVFECRCKSWFSSGVSLKQHILRSHISKIYKCKKCQAACPTHEYLKSHLLREHGISEDCDKGNNESHAHYVCQLCPGMLENGSLPAKHVNFHVPGKSVVQDVIKCGRCKKIIADIGQIPMHRSVCFMSKEKVVDSVNLLCNENFSGAFVKIGDTSPHSSLASVCLNDGRNSLLLERPAFQECAVEPTVNILNLSLPSNVQGTLSNEQTTSRSPLGEACGKKTVSDVQNFAPSDATNSVNSDVLSKNSSAGEFIHCRICKHSIAISGDRIAVKKHFLDRHQALFLQALHNGRRNLSGDDKKVICKFPIQKMLHKEQKITKASVPNPVKKGRRCSPVTSHKKGNNSPKVGEVSNSSKKVGSNKLKKSANKLEMSPFKIGTIVAPNNVGKNRKCYKCSFSSENRLSFAKHIIIHKTNSSDLQCPICGMCFIVRPPLEKHLFVQHKVKHISDFLKKHGFEDIKEEESEKPAKVEDDPPEELQENQCKVCKMQFDSAFLLEKHFRVHGGAFLLASLKAKK